jgi:hypothetical protein
MGIKQLGGRSFNVSSFFPVQTWHLSILRADSNTRRNKVPSKLAQAVTLLTYVREIPGLILSRNDYPEENAGIIV